MAAPLTRTGSPRRVVFGLVLGLIVSLTPAWAGRPAQAAASAGSEIGDWPQFHRTANHIGDAPSESILNSSNVAGLQVLWSLTTGNSITGGPAIVDGIVYVASTDGKVYARKVTTGAAVWTSPMVGPIRSVPAVVNGLVYVTSSDGKVYALKTTTGAIQWTATTGGPNISSPAVVSGLVYVSSMDGSLYAFNAASGARQWEMDNFVTSRASPTVDEGRVVTGFDNGELMGVNATSGQPLWTTDLGGAVRTGPTIVGGVVYTGTDDGRVYAVDAATGAIRWSSPTSGVDGTVVRSSPVVVNGLVYVVTGETVPMVGRVWAFNAATGSLVWWHGMGDYATASSAYANGVLFTASFDHRIYGFDATTGTKLWSLAPGDRGINSALAVSNGTVFVAALDGKLYALADRLAPSVTMDSSPPAVTSQRSASFVFHATETVSGAITCRLDGTLATDCSTGRFNITDLIAGSHTLKITATDLSQIVGTTTFTWQIDLTPPVLSIVSGPTGSTSSTLATFKLSSNETLGSMNCRLDLSSWTSCGSPATYTGLANGVHTFSATGVDLAGNFSAPVSHTWTMDSVAPTVTILSGPVGTVSSNTATFEFSGNESGLTFKCSRNGKPFAICASPYTITNLPNGPKTFVVYAVDAAGSQSSKETWTWTVNVIS